MSISFDNILKCEYWSSLSQVWNSLTFRKIYDWSVTDTSAHIWENSCWFQYFIFCVVEKEKIEKEKEMEKKEKRDYSVYFMVTEKKCIYELLLSYFAEIDIMISLTFFPLFCCSAWSSSWRNSELWVLILAVP